MTVKEMAIQYYVRANPKLWDKDRIKALVISGKLTETEYEEITGEKWTEVE